MTGYLLAPGCECGSRQTRARVDPDADMVVVRCENCDNDLVTADVLGAEGVFDLHESPDDLGEFERELASQLNPGQIGLMVLGRSNQRWWVRKCADSNRRCRIIR